MLKNGMICADVEKLWPASAASRNALNADERINAATAPAVLTRPVASTASTTAGDHLRKDKQHRRNGAIFKVKQPSQRLSRDPSQVFITFNHLIELIELLIS